MQAPLWSWTALAASLPPGLLLGALLVYDAALALPFLWVIAFAAAGVFPWWTLLALLRRAVHRTRRN